MGQNKIRDSMAAPINNILPFIIIPSKALGPDELHPRVLKELATELGPIFAHLFQQSIDSGDIPKEWTLANISPLFKKGDRSLACNYRPVSLTCVPCKLLEHIVCSNIIPDSMTTLGQHSFSVVDSVGPTLESDVGPT